MTTEIYVIMIAAAAAVVILFTIFARRAGRRTSGRNDKDIAYARAVGCLIEGKKDEALVHLKEAVRLNPENIHAYIKLGDLFRERGEIDRALQVHRELTVRHDADARTEKDLYGSLARDYLAAGRLSDAKAATEKVLGYDKKDEEALEVMALVYERGGELEQAFEVHEELARRRKDDGKAFLATYKSYIGTDYLARGDRQKAKKSFESALHMDKDCLPALLYLGDIHYEEGDRKKAMEKWVDFTSRFAQWAHIVYGRLEKAYYESGTFGEIEHVYENVLRESPNHIPTLLAMAEMNQKRGVFDEAMRLVRETLEMDPDCRRARQLLVRLRLEKGDADAALDDVLSFLEESKPGEGGFACSGCGYESKEVLFRCPNCREWNTFLS